MVVERTERGWAGHYICVNRCRFRRNTLLEYGDIKIVVSSVGLQEKAGGGFETVGHNRYFETMAFHVDPEDTRYHDIDVGKQVDFESEWSIGEIDADDKANDMHEKVVEEITNGLLNGNVYCS
ncbi:hypothetical protein H8E88_35800 [candidate division KSB1 bacterium]|nr:hypothetical protein [candidate division KSB1 bacterium]